MNIDKILKKYTDFYNGKSYSDIATLIRESELSVKAKYSHRTLRRKISEFLQHNSSFTLREEQVSIPKESRPDTIPWNEERVIEYFKNTNNTIPVEKLFQNSIVNNTSELKTYIILGCIHFPFHNKPFWNATLKFIEELADNDNLHGIILNGDILDMHSISRHNKSRITIPGLTLEEEYRLTNLELDRLDRIIDTRTEKHYTYGNHEMWYYQYMSEVDANKLGQGVVKSPKEALRLEERGYKVQTDYRVAHVTVGDTEVHHGTYVNKHAANKHAESMRRNNVFNHTHRTGSYLESNMFSYNLGWMGDKEAKVFGYMDRIQKETWTNGFGRLTIDSDNKTHVEQITWKNNRFIYSGKEYKG